MTDTHQHKSPKPQWRSLESPMLWLAYLPMFFIPWFIQAPTPIQIIGATIGVTIFLVVYCLAIGATGWRLIICSIVTLFIAIALIPTYGNWTVIAIYAAAMIGDLRPTRRAAILVGAFAFIAVLAGIISQQNPFYWGFGIFMMVMVGIGTISTAALRDKNHALTKAQIEVKQLAAIAERERIGRDLHDMLGSTLTLIAIKADLAARLAASDPQGAEAEMRAVAATARDGLADVRACRRQTAGAHWPGGTAASCRAPCRAGHAGARCCRPLSPPGSTQPPGNHSRCRSPAPGPCTPRARPAAARSCGPPHWAWRGSALGRWAGHLQAQCGGPHW
eukprot:gene17762-24765_t